MDVRLVKKSGHKFFEFLDDGVIRTVCVDGWINANICPSFCTPVLQDGWEPLPDDRRLKLFACTDYFKVVCPTCFGYVSRRGFYRNTGPFHMDLVFHKADFRQFLYNYTIGG